MEYPGSQHRFVGVCTSKSGGREIAESAFQWWNDEDQCLSLKTPVMLEVSKAALLQVGAKDSLAWCYAQSKIHWDIICKINDDHLHLNKLLFALRERVLFLREKSSKKLTKAIDIVPSSRNIMWVIYVVLVFPVAIFKKVKRNKWD